MSEKIDYILYKILDGSANVSEKEQFTSWIDLSPENRSYFDSLKAIWEKSTRPSTDLEFDVEKAKVEIIRRIQNRSVSRSFKLSRLLVAATVAVLVTIAGLIIAKPTNLRVAHTYSANDSIVEVLLPDSTHVWLNTGSTIKVAKNYNFKSRKIRLNGEAFFDVKKNPDIPFKVLAGVTTTKVLGTSFNLRYTGENNVLLDVTSGNVLFSRTRSFGKTLTLSKGEGAVYLHDGKEIKKHSKRRDNHRAWQTKVLSFYNTSLEVVAQDLSAYYQKSIIADPEVYDLSLTGEFRKESLENILSIIEITLDVEVTETNEGILITNTFTEVNSE